MVECFNQIWEEKRIFIANQGNIAYRIFKNIYKKLFPKHLFSNMSNHQDLHIIHNEYTGDSILFYQKKPI